MEEAYFIGIDIGTQGIRAVLLDSRGEIVAEGEQSFPLNDLSREEQSPELWWEACTKILGDLIPEARRKINIENIRAIAVTSTSGTVIPLDKNNYPLHDALMYSDKRSAETASTCKEAAEHYFGDQTAYTHFNASSGLCKMIWYVRHFPEKVSRIAHWVHATDFITGKLCGKYDITDETNALKSGYDIFSSSWPDYLYESLPLQKEWIPQTVPSGTPIGTLSEHIGRKLGLHHEIKVVAGMTDGCASQIASGAVKAGDWNTTIGTTMVIKGVTRKPVSDPKGRLYNHRHPEGYFMPGGAGNTGADWISLDFKKDFKSLSNGEGTSIPSGYISWPLRTAGERFPIIAPQARGFEPEGLSRQEKFIANMEGVAYLEKYAYEMIEVLSGEQVKAVYTAGGGSKSNLWLKIRSCVLNLPIYKMKHVTGAVGAAVLAASKTYFNSLTAAAEQLTQVEKTIIPDTELVEQYSKEYNRFVAALKERGYTDDQ